MLQIIFCNEHEWLETQLCSGNWRRSSARLSRTQTSCECLNSGTSMDTCAYTCAGNTLSSSFLSVVFTEVSSLLESGRCGRSRDGRNTLLTTEHSRRHWSTSRCLCVCSRVCACVCARAFHVGLEAVWS